MSDRELKLQAEVQQLTEEVCRLHKCLDDMNGSWSRQVEAERKQHQAELERLRSRGSTCCDKCSFWSTSEGRCSLGDPRENSQCGEFLENEDA